MQTVLEALNDIVIPRLRSGTTGIVPCQASIVPQTGQLLELQTSYEFEHNFFEWFWLLDGQAHMRIENKIYVLEAGDTCYLPPHIRHADVYNEQSPAYRSLWFTYFRGSFIAQIFEYQPVANWSSPTYEPTVFLPQVASILTQLQAEFQSPTLYSDDMKSGLILQLASWVARGLQEDIDVRNQKALSNDISRRVIHFLEEKYGTELTLADVGREVCLSPNYVASLFKRETGNTIFEVLGDIRLRHSSRLLMEGKMTVHEVARAVGFQDSSQFSHFFRRKMGIPPSHYGRK